jgi:hypothetical protein
MTTAYVSEVCPVPLRAYLTTYVVHQEIAHYSTFTPMLTLHRTSVGSSAN